MIYKRKIETTDLSYSFTKIIVNKNDALRYNI